MLNSSITQHHHHGNVYTPKTRTTLEQRDSSPDMALRQFTSRPGFEIPDEVDRDEVDGDEPGTTIGEPYDDVLRSHSRPHTIAAPPRYPRYADPEIRKKTFASWANPFPSIELLIASGFFFLGEWICSLFYFIRKHCSLLICDTVSLACFDYLG